MTPPTVPMPMFAAPVAAPFRWFAWRPVRTADRGLRWLRPVWRTRMQTHEYLPGPLHTWFHTTVGDPRGSL